MPIVKQIESRRAYRALDSRPIPEEALGRLVEAAQMAPSCANSQPWRILIARDPAALAALKESLTPGNYWAKPAPAIAAFVTSLGWDARLDAGRDYAFFDLGQAAMAFQLQAVEEGLYVHPIAGFDPVRAKIALEIPEEAVLVALVILGYPGDPSGLNEKHRALEGSARTRKPIAEVSSFDRWSPELLPPPAK
jgi:nitroreductase